MQKLSEACDQLPSSLFITGVNDRDEDATFAGGFGDVYRASYSGKKVALKRIRTFTADSSPHRTRLVNSKIPFDTLIFTSLGQQFCREALVWRGLQHRFILPFLGIDRETFPSSFCMVSPWMKHGTVLIYLKNRGHGELYRVLLEIAQGLEYLHSRSVVHGDLRGSNILISDEGSACLSDFGLATTVDEAETSTGGATSSSNRAGSIRWFAPELIEPTAFGCERFVRTRASDVYAYGCVCLELYTRRPPFHPNTDGAVINMIMQGKRPEQPAGLSDEFWHFICAAWVSDFRARPTISDHIVEFPTPPTATDSVQAPS
ncbi:kinase-like domain-containing protein [Mycena sp. CBHHK59/15]|nr:kinase-like domain-containing protein [Mycena sp. CBHHK59/15]